MPDSLTSMRKEKNQEAPVPCQIDRLSLIDDSVFTLISEQMPDALFLLDLDDPETPGKIVYANEIACQIHGYTRNELLGRSIGDLDDEHTVAHVKPRLETLLTGVTLNFEGGHKRKDGSLFPVEVTARLVVWQGRRFVLALDRDISERKQAQEALQLSENQYRMLFSASERQSLELALVDRVRTVLSREMDLSVVFKTIIEAVSETFQYSHVAVYLLKEQALYAQYYTGFELLASPLPLSMGIIGRTARTGEPSLVEDVFKDPDYLVSSAGIGSEVCVPLIDRGTVVGVLNVESKKERPLTDTDLILMLALSEHIGVAIGRARLHSEVIDSETRYRNLVEQLSDIIFTLNPQGVITYISPVIRGYSGYAPEELLGRAFTALMDQRDGPMLIGKVQEMIAGEATPFEFQIRTKDGDRRWVRSSGRVITDEQGTVEVHGILIDLTDRKRMEEERIRLSKLESLGVLAGGIAHDFNNLLTGILGNLSIAELILPPENDAYRNIKNAEQALMRAKDLTYQLLTFAKGGTPVKATVLLKSVLPEIATFVLHGSKTKCECHIEDALLPINADIGQITQVFQNIIINADQSMPKGGSIEIDASNVTIDSTNRPEGVVLLDGVYVRVRVSDCGHGIAPEHLAKIFDPYFTTKEEGSGLGLATAHSIITQHGGTVTLLSTLGIGTRFTLYFPALVDGLPAKEPVSPTLKSTISTKNEGRVLVLDDEEMILALIKQTLTRYGYDVVVTSDGVDTLASYDQARREGHPFDVVVLDLTIPGGTGGREVIEKLRTHDSEVIAIVSSGYYNDPVLANYREYGFSGMVPKPYKVQELLQVIQQAMLKRHGNA